MNNLFTSIVNYVIDVVANNHKLGVRVPVSPATMCKHGFLSPDIVLVHKMGLYADGINNPLFYAIKEFDYDLPLDGVKDIGVNKGIFKLVTSDLTIYFYVTMSGVKRDSLTVYIDTKAPCVPFTMP